MIKSMNCRHYYYYMKCAHNVVTKSKCLAYTQRVSLNTGHNKSDSNSSKKKSANTFVKPLNDSISTNESGVHSNISKSLNANDLLFRVTLTEMKRFLSNNKLMASEGYTCLSLSCPLCAHCDERSEALLYINKTMSTYVCHNCNETGNWTHFVELVSALKNNKIKSHTNYPAINKSLIHDKNTENQCKSVYDNSLTFNSLTKRQMSNVLDKFKLMGLTKSSLSHFDVRISSDFNKLLFPLKDINNNVMAIKTMQFTNDRDFYEECIIPSNSELSVFGLQHMNDIKSDELVITESAMDAIAVTQQTAIPCVSLSTNGVSAQLHPQVLPFFEKFNKITLWFGSSIQDFNSAKIMARKLNEKRCHIVCLNNKIDKHETPLNALQSNTDLNKYLESAQQISHEAITTFHSLRHEILSEIIDPHCSGVLWNRYPELNKHLKGHRNGELTIFTGPTGCGKTTFMSEYSLDLCMQGVRTLWGSFEVKNVRLAKMMLTQFAEKAITKHLNEFDLVADKFEQLPLYFMTFHGQESINNVLSAMSHAVYVHDIKHIIIDNIQFMLGCDAKQYKFDRYWQQDLVLGAFRKFATQEDCHVTLVIHPRKEDDMNELNNNSIFGGVKASQEADNILILQNKYLPMFKCQKYVEITKNRYDGDLGKVPLWFDKESLSYSPPNRRLSNMYLKESYSDYQHKDDSDKQLEFTRIKCNTDKEIDDLLLQ